MRMSTITGAAALSLAAGSAGAGYSHDPFVTVKIMAINDFHRQLESPGTFRLDSTSTQSVAVGGVDWIAGYIAKIKSENPYTTVVSAGDLIGATP